MKTMCLAFLLAACAFAQKPPKPPKDGLYAILKTEFGDMRAVLYEKDTPASVSLFVGLAQGTQQFRDIDGKIVRKPYYDNTTFFRIVPDSAIQGGSLTGKTTFNCGLRIKDELLPGLKFRGGSLAVANTGQPDTGGCMFFITLGPMPSWDMKYSIFGQLVDGDDVLRKLGRVAVHGEEPVEPPKLISVTIQRVGPAPVIKKKK
jgi:peptidyl-prolyl cis-trans isomerase A (cyclophilin A)